MPGSRGFAVKLLDAVAVVGASVQEHFIEPVENHTIFAKVVDANTSISALTITLEGSPDPQSILDASAEWITVDTHAFSGGELTALKAAWNVANFPLKRLRVNITVITDEGAGDTITVWYQRGMLWQLR